jgi:hypothetical protein
MPGRVDLADWIDQARQFIRGALPPCAICGGTAVPGKCVFCERYFCAEHAWFRKCNEHDEGNSLLECICMECFHGIIVKSQKNEHPWPWELLGLEPPVSAAEVNRTYRKLAAALHPDKQVGNRATEQLFKLVDRAKTEAIAIIDEIRKEENDRWQRR